MKKFILPILVAGGLSLSAAAPASAMTDDEMIGMGHAMLLSFLENALSRRGVESNGIENLTLEEVVELQAVLSSSDSNNPTIKQNAMRILDEANTR